MAIVFQPISVLHSGTAASSVGRASGSPDVLREVRMTGGLAAHPTAAGALIARFPELDPDLVITEVRGIFLGAVPAGEPKLFTALAGDDAWWLTTTAGATIRFVNDALAPITTSSPVVVGLSVVNTQVPAIVFGPTIVALWAAAPVSVTIICKVAQRNREAWSGAQFGSFWDTVTNPTADAQLEQLLLEVSRRGGAQYPTQGNVGAVGAPPYPAKSVKQDAVIIDAEFAAPSPYGNVWCSSTDVGPSTTERIKLPAELASNNVAAYNRYAASFFRRPNFERGVQHAGLRWGGVDGADITTFAGALTIYTTTEDLKASRWLFQIEGVQVRATIVHDTYTGLRRPADIWNQVIVNRFAANGPISSQGILGTDGLIQRLEYLEWATFLGGYSDRNLTNAFPTPLVQVGAPSPVP